MIGGLGARLEAEACFEKLLLVGKEVREAVFKIAGGEPDDLGVVAAGAVKNLGGIVDAYVGFFPAMPQGLVILQSK